MAFSQIVFILIAEVIEALLGNKHFLPSNLSISRIDKLSSILVPLLYSQSVGSGPRDNRTSRVRDDRLALLFFARLLDRSTIRQLPRDNTRRTCLPNIEIPVSQAIKRYVRINGSMAVVNANETRLV